MAGKSKRQRINKKIGEAVSKMKPETVNKLEAAFIIGASIDEACFYADISPQTYYNWGKKNPKLLERFKAVKHKAILKAKQAVFNKLDGSYATAMDYLSRKAPEEYSTKTGSAAPPPEPTKIFNDKQAKDIARRVLANSGEGKK